MFIFLLLFSFGVGAKPIKSIVVPEELFLKYAYSYHVSAQMGSTKLERITSECVSHLLSTNDKVPKLKALKDKLLKASFNIYNSEFYLKKALLGDKSHAKLLKVCLIDSKKRIK